MPPPRSSTTCAQCRARKVKCTLGSSQRAACINCGRLGFGCSFVNSSVPQEADAAPPQRKRGSRACIECRSHKSKCTGELPSCASCLKRGIECVYSGKRRQRAVERHQGSTPSMSSSSHGPSPAVSSSSKHAEQRSLPPSFTVAAATNSPNTSWRSPSSFNSDGRVCGYPLPLPPVREQLQLVNDFFRHIYPLPIYSFLNEVSVTQRCLDQTLDKTLLLSLCAVTALQLKYVKYHPTFTASWVKQAEDAIWENLGQPSIFRAQALLLVVRYRVDTGDFQKAFMLASLAARSASALRLQYERTDIGSLAQEVRRRLMWCLALSDNQFSLGLPECEMCPFEAIYLQLPCAEEKFTAESEHAATSMGPLDGISEDGLMAINLREAMIRRDIMRLKRQLSLSTQPMPQLEGIITEFKHTLDSLPIPRYDFSELRRLSHSRWLVRYLNVQLSWNQCHCDIYRHFLSGYPEAASEAITSAFSAAYKDEAVHTCLQHAQANLKIIADFVDMGSAMVVGDMDMAICGYHAARIVLFVSRSNLKPQGSDLTPDQAISAARVVLTLLKRYFSQSPLAAKLEKTLEFLMEPNNSGGLQASRSSSLDGEDEASSRAPRFALAAKQYQRLGVHSILRQARFVDDSYDVISGQGSSSRRDTSSLGNTTSGSEQPLAASFATSLAPFNSEMPVTNDAEAASVSSFNNMIEISQFHLNTDPFNWGSADNWSEFYLPPDFSAAADGNFF